MLALLMNVAAATTLLIEEDSDEIQIADSHRTVTAPTHDVLSSAGRIRGHVTRQTSPIHDSHFPAIAMAIEQPTSPLCECILIKQTHKMKFNL